MNQKTHRLKLNDQISHFHTPDAQKSWRDMAAQKFTPSDGQFHFGLDYDTTWIRFSLKNTASMPLDFYLEIDYAIIASLELYTLQGDDAKRQVTGTDVPFKKRPDPYRNPIFKIKTPAQSETTFYLKADSLGPKIMPLQLLSPAEMFAQRESEKSYFGFYYGVIFSIMLINTLTFFTFREKIYLYYVGLLSSLHVILIPYAFGINLPYLLPHSGGLGSTIGSLSQVAVAIFFVLFTRELLNLKTLHPKIAQIYKGLMVLSVVFGAKIILFGDHVEDLYLMPVVLTSLLFLAFAGSYNGIKARQAHAILFVVSWSGVFVGMVVFMMTIFNVFDFLGGRFILLAGAEMEAIFLSLAIHFKIKAVKKDHDLAQTKVDQIQTYLNHLVPQSFMNEIMSNPEILTGPPRSKEITIMFVDMVAFSRITERKDAAEVFKRAKASLDELRHSIKKHNGVIDRSLGDGILCFFGYQSDQSRESSALEASRCAIEIQTKAARRLASETNTDLSFCYRIGINTDIVSIGNMGSETAPDFTVAGQGVVAAARFETSCDPFMILMGEHTYSYLKKAEEPTPIHKAKLKWIQIKHQKNLVPAYEINPFAHDAGLLNDARFNFYKQLRVEMKHPRYQVTTNDLSLQIGEENCNIINYSANGFGVTSRRYWGRNVVLKVGLMASDSQVQKLIETYQLHSFKVTVRWGIMVGLEEFRHGMEIISLNEDQLTILHEICHNSLNESQSEPTPSIRLKSDSA